MQAHRDTGARKQKTDPSMSARQPLTCRTCQGGRAGTLATAMIATPTASLYDMVSFLSYCCIDTVQLVLIGAFGYKDRFSNLFEAVRRIRGNYILKQVMGRCLSTDRKTENHRQSRYDQAAHAFDNARCRKMRRNLESPRKLGRGGQSSCAG